MPSRDMYSDMAVQQSLTPAVQTGTDIDVNAAAVNHTGFQSVVHCAAIGVSGDTLSASVKIQAILEDSSDGVSFVPVANADYVNGTVDANGVFATIDDATKDDAIYSVGYVGPKQYSRIKLSLVGAHSIGTPLAAMAMLGDPEIAPISA